MSANIWADSEHAEHVHNGTLFNCKEESYKWVKLEMIVLIEVTETKKDEHHIFSRLQYQAPSPQIWVNTLELQKPGEGKGAVGKGDLRGD